MKCQTCEQVFPDASVKVYRGKRVCPGCFQALVAAGASAEGEPQTQVVQTKFVVTTVCPECNTEVHADTSTCPVCGALVQRVDRNVRAFKRAGFITLGVFGLMMVIGSIGVSFEKRDATNLLIGLPLAGLSIAWAIWGYRRTPAATGTRER